MIKSPASKSVTRSVELEDTDFEVPARDKTDTNELNHQSPWWHQLKYAAVGLIFGIVFVKAEVISWFRIQEMFRFQNFHMYGVIGSAVVVGMISVWLIKKYKVKTINGASIVFQSKKFNKGQIIGGLIFGFGWAMTGACPGPLFAQIAIGFSVVIVVLISAIAGTWIYGYFRDQLPH